MLGIHPYIEGAIAVSAFALVTLTLWVTFARRGSDDD
jgi:hypothetical protein